LAAGRCLNIADPTPDLVILSSHQNFRRWQNKKFVSRFSETAVKIKKFAQLAGYALGNFLFDPLSRLRCPFRFESFFVSSRTDLDDVDVIPSGVSARQGR
jgi:hypothetical protein